MKTVIIGAGALGRIAANTFDFTKDLVFYDDDPDKIGTKVNGIPVSGPVEDIYELDREQVELLIGIGNINVRRELYDQFLSKGYSFTDAVHPTASVAPSATIGPGCIVKDQATVEVGAEIGANTIVGNGATVCHDTTVGDHCRLAPAVTIAGHCTIGDRSYLAVDVSVDRNCTIGEDTIIASGCTIWKDVLQNSVVKLPQVMDRTDRADR